MDIMPAIPVDFQFSYSRDNGSLPPPYHVEIAITGGSSSECVLNFRCGYGEPGDLVQIVHAAPDNQQLTSLYAAVEKAGLFEHVWAPDPLPSVGGSTAWAEVVANGKSLRIPAGLGEEPTSRVRPFYDEIESLFSAEIWERLWQKREEWIGSYK